MAGFAPEVLDLLRNQSVGIGGLGHWTKFHVRHPDDGGSDSNNGESWAKAFASIQNGLDAVEALDKRGKGIVLVGPGAYTETLTTPLNADAPFGALLGVTPTPGSRGSVYLASEAPGEPVLTVRARGWRISGFEFAGPTAEAAIKLMKDGETLSADYTQIDHCHITGGLLGIDGYGAPSFVRILDNLFDFILEGDGRAIDSGLVSTSNPNVWEILRNTFWANKNHIFFSSGFGPGNATIMHNVLHKHIVAGDDVGYMISLGGGGGANVITQNFLGGDYSVVGGYRSENPDDEWFGNYANVEHGITQNNPG